MNKLVIIQKKISNKHSDSFWYDGEIARIGKYSLIACGDIEIKSKEGERVFARGRKYADEINFKDDEDLEKKVGNNYEDELFWENNNWFEVIDRETGEDILGDFVYYYDEGIKLLKVYYKEKIFG